MAASTDDVPPNLAATLLHPTPPFASSAAAAAATLPPPFAHTEPAPLLLAQGAEALVFKTHFLDPALPCALKYRPAKSWRHPALDARLTRHRILGEARALVRCRREGVSVPGVLALDWEGGGGGEATEGGDEGGRRKSGGWMMMEWIEGRTIRGTLDAWMGATGGRRGQGGAAREAGLLHLMARVGRAVGRMHSIGVVHGDLTTSNLMLRPLGGGGSGATVVGTGDGACLEGEVVLIDFGLAAQSVQDEDRAVDLYVLERALGSTHPGTEDLFAELLGAYGPSYKGAHVVLKRLDEVRTRGRKRSMLG